MQDRRDAGRGGREVSAEARPDRRPQAEDRAVLLRRHLDVLDVVAAVDRRAVVLAARLRPLDRDGRASSPRRRPSSPRGSAGSCCRSRRPTSGAMTRILCSGVPVSSESRKRAMCGFWEVTQSVSSSGRSGPLRERRPRLHRVRDQALVDDPLLHDDVGGAEGRLDVAARDVPVEADVVRDVGVDLRRALLRRLPRVDDHGQRLVVHLDRVGGVARGVAVRRRPRSPRRCRRSARCRSRSAGRAGVLVFEPGTTHAQGIGPKPASFMSWPVKTPSTPGIPAAFCVRIALIRACA